MSHLILIWDPLNLYHFWTLQIKLSNFARSTPPTSLMGLYIYLSNKQKNGIYKAYSVKYGHFLYYFYTNLNFQRPISHFQPIKVPSFLHFADQSEQLWQI